MPTYPSSAQARGRIGGLTRAATAPTRQDITAAANSARWQKYVDQIHAVLPELTDPAEIRRRAELLMRADMARLSQKAAAARRLRRELKAAEDALAAAKLAVQGAVTADDAA